MLKKFIVNDHGTQGDGNARTAAIMGAISESGRVVLDGATDFADIKAFQAWIKKNWPRYSVQVDEEEVINGNS